jgi:methionyl-tRNA formyltransferase
LTSLRAELAKIGAELLVEHLRTGLRSPTPQHGDATIAAKIAPAELEIDWARPAEELERLVRLGGAWTTFRGKRIKITAASVVDGHLEPAIVQPEGKAPMTAVAWRNGARPGPGEQFGS